MAENQSPAFGVVPSGSAPERIETEQFSIVFDGQLHNRVELATILGKADVLADSDARLILQAYHRWGEESFRRLRGSFALIVWDGRNDSLLAVRDPVGTYPLFYAVAGDQILFSTSIDDLLGQADVSRDVNRNALASHLLDLWQRPEETYFSAIRRVPPGHLLKVHASGRQLVRYWNPAAPHEAVDWIAEEALAQFDLLLRQAVRRCIGDGATAFFLSGGLDSVTVAVVAAEECARENTPPPLALSLAFPDSRGIAEQAVQRNVGKALGISHVFRGFEEAIGANGLLLEALELSSRSPAPLLNRADPAYHSLGLEGLHRGCSVVLTGGGGDEWLSVSPSYAADLISSGNALGLIRFVRTMRRSHERPTHALVHQLLWSAGLRMLLQSATQRVLRIEDPPVCRTQYRRRFLESIPAWLAPDSELRKELADRAEERLDDQHSDSFYLRELRLLLEHPLESMRQEELFAGGRRLGMKLLRPFWDADLVDFLYRVPPPLKNQGGRSKALVRPLLTHHLPDLAFGRQKKVDGPGLQRYVSAADWARAWDTLGGAPALHEAGAVDSSALQLTVSSLLTASNEIREQRLWTILNLEAWTQPRLR